jgi:hypothetical protein
MMPHAWMGIPFAGIIPPHRLSVRQLTRPREDTG